jgi:diguanylate cyclase (GGDEF)-like protein
MAERIRTAVADFPFTFRRSRVKVTCSIGVADNLHGGADTSILDLADGALYRAKQDGRDRAVVASGEPTATPHAA